MVGGGCAHGVEGGGCAHGRDGSGCGSRSGARRDSQARMASQSDGGDGRNRTVGIEAGAWLCVVYTIVLRISRDLRWMIVANATTLSSYLVNKKVFSVSYVYISDFIS